MRAEYLWQLGKFLRQWWVSVSYILQWPYNIGFILLADICTLCAHIVCIS